MIGSRPGVAFAPPPAEFLPSIKASLDRAVVSLPAGKTGAVVGIATESGVNAAVIAKVDTRWTVQAWVGKKWAGPIEGGVQVMLSW